MDYIWKKIQTITKGMKYYIVFCSFPILLCIIPFLNMLHSCLFRRWLICNTWLIYLTSIVSVPSSAHESFMIMIIFDFLELTTRVPQWNLCTYILYDYARYWFSNCIHFKRKRFVHYANISNFVIRLKIQFP